ncbi:hypothetical protein B0H10DRAFT_2242445 [Mycena sp. CBHHK59/15]|nr:hypothetical protein B0H10DRAFT_2242445 [Mycena sp. CBHHK59/15]
MSAYKARPSPTQSTPTPAPRNPPARVSSRSDHLVRYAFVAPPLALLSRDGVCFTRRLAAASCAPSPQHIAMRDASGPALSPAVPASASRLLRIPAPPCRCAVSIAAYLSPGLPVSVHICGAYILHSQPYVSANVCMSTEERARGACVARPRPTLTVHASQPDVLLCCCPSAGGPTCWVLDPSDAALTLRRYALNYT